MSFTMGMLWRPCHLLPRYPWPCPTPSPPTSATTPRLLRLACQRQHSWSQLEHQLEQGRKACSPTPTTPSPPAPHTRPWLPMIPPSLLSSLGRTVYSTVHQTCSAPGLLLGRPFKRPCLLFNRLRQRKRRPRLRLLRIFSYNSMRRQCLGVLSKHLRRGQRNIQSQRSRRRLLQTWRQL